MTNRGDGSKSTYTTPGVYIQELGALPPSIVGVQTAIPIFIGYTEYAGDPASGAALYNQPVAIASMAEYTAYFGGPPPRHYRIEPLPPTMPPTVAPNFVANSTSPAADGGWAVASSGYLIVPEAAQPFLLHRQMQLYFANGGGNCYVVSAGSYWANQSPVSAPDPQGWTLASASAAALSAGLAAAAGQKGPAMTVIPEVCTLDSIGYATIATAMLAQGGALQDRMAILDLPGSLKAMTIDVLEARQNQLWTALAPEAANVSYGAVYAPAVNATVVLASEVDFTRLAGADNALINDLLTTQAFEMYGELLQPPAQLAALQSAIAAAFPLPATLPKQNTPQYSGDASAYPDPGGDPVAWAAALDAALAAALPLYSKLMHLILNDMNVQPVSGVIAGVWSKNDEVQGVWTAPANITLAGVMSPLYAMNDDQQADFNVPLNGMAIDIIRQMIGRGPVIWGARTLNGNSDDYRYIQVRRTLIYIEQSIQQALQTLTFQPNSGATWAAATGMISNFLTQLWMAGGLMGGKASDAFQVQCGIGSTMTGQDILNGVMVVSVTLQMIRPAEFIVLTFQQQMQGGY